MTTIEDAIKSEQVQKVLRELAHIIKWGEVITEIKDGKPVMTRVKKDIKHS